MKLIKLVMEFDDKDNPVSAEAIKEQLENEFAEIGIQVKITIMDEKEF